MNIKTTGQDKKQRICLENVYSSRLHISSQVTAHTSTSSLQQMTMSVNIFL